ncbi:metallophosphatase domain-containing protein [Parasphingopyxis lamellibrachiae]|uniref:Icc-related predicted phosphoesterase n=1 Tax=Parasphingopyxis lamellibrachiae TaxID=680125 RepID=A0A3D9FD28_9SPHN|nr:metallophosphatase domain-containing protein [Parasphingopyxis lamellibrachiae]RED15725.1 Icc-related predicted phosphoesterase [Parasphingopyxis lamellibrachiae]
MSVSVTIISDTHAMHGSLSLPGGDILIHCGDMLDLFDRDAAALTELDDWFGRQNYPKILVTGGNHDLALEAALARTQQPFRNARYIQDERLTVEGLDIYAAPWVPELASHAFYLDEGALREKWAAIPSGLDILITHVPPAGILDHSRRGHSHGCPHLAAEIARIAPRLHCFGHVHASAGESHIGDTLFVNASSAISGERAVRAPFVLEVEPDRPA